MIWIIVAGIVIFFVVKMIVSYQQDNVDLKERGLQEKFHVIISRLNEYAFNSNGVITKFDKRECNLYDEGSNQIINFLYSQGTLMITWKFNYFQKEVMHKKNFLNTRNLSLFEQRKMADAVINEMEKVVREHKEQVLPAEEVQQYIEQSVSQINDGQEFSQFLYEFSEDFEVFAALRNAEGATTHRLINDLLLLKLLSFQLKEKKDIELIITSDLKCQYKSCFFSLDQRLVELNNDAGVLFFFTNSLEVPFMEGEDEEEIHVKHIILHLQEDQVVNWFHVGETDSTTKVILNKLYRHGEVEKLAELENYEWETAVDKLNEILERKPEEDRISDLLDDFYNNLG